MSDSGPILSLSHVCSGQIYTFFFYQNKYILQPTKTQSDIMLNNIEDGDPGPGPLGGV